MFTSDFCAQLPYPLPCGSDIFVRYKKSGLAGPHRLMSSPDTCIGLRIYVEHFIFRLMYAQFYLCIDLWRYRSHKMFRNVDVLMQCHYICSVINFKQVHEPRNSHIWCQEVRSISSFQYQPLPIKPQDTCDVTCRLSSHFVQYTLIVRDQDPT